MFNPTISFVMAAAVALYSMHRIWSELVELLNGIIDRAYKQVVEKEEGVEWSSFLFVDICFVLFWIAVMLVAIHFAGGY